ncbi:MAG: hypothetical protein PHI27_10005 [Eubacteriales bacterium]|nr:hypothetical protein [Eubacteriales bacterium]MDD4513408.1 hypothetical protein [Eubacteriales bacterium]
MKKVVSILLALAMTLTLTCVAFADAPAVEEVNVEYDESYVQVSLGEECFTFIPADWTTVEPAADAAESVNLLGAFTNADKTISLGVAATTFETAATYESIYDETVKAGLTASLQSINGTEFACMAATNETGATIVYTYLINPEGTEAYVFSFFVAASAMEGAETILNQIMASFGYFEAGEQ